MRQLRSFVLLLLLLLLLAAPASATRLTHADYARSEPAADALLTEPPRKVKVWFTQELFRRDGENWVRVTGPDGTRVDLDDTTVDDDDRTLASVSLAEALPDGVYTVAWRGLSAEDGHPGEGEFTFTVAANPAPPQETPAANQVATSEPATLTAPTVAVTLVATPAPSNSGSSGGLPCLGASPVVMLAFAGVLIGRKKRSSL